MLTADDDLGRFGSFWTAVDSAGVLVVDLGAEATVAGCALATAEGARLARRRLSRADFFDLRLADVVEVAAELPADLPEPPSDAIDLATLTGCRGRIEAVAEITGDPTCWLVGLVEGRAVAVDRPGWHARRVRAAALTRRWNLMLLEGLESAGVDTSALIGRSRRWVA